ncbi:MAG: glycosyltransferase family 2 protein [Candidatus Paceibacterota bacterium]
MTSILIPSRNEQFLQKTIDDILSKATGEIEIIAVLDGYWSVPKLKDYPNLTIIHLPRLGMRTAINASASIAKGKYLLKCDAHCIFAQGFDEVLVKDCQEDWVVIPRRYRMDSNNLDIENWKYIDDKRAPVDYHYLCYPGINDGLHGIIWKDRAMQRKDFMIDDEMSSQGSCWFMHKSYFDRFNGVQEEGYGSFCQEFQQIGLRTWLSGGRVVVNKNTWYAHLYKGKAFGRMYTMDTKDVERGKHWSCDYWMNNRWKERKYDIEWLIDKFSPVPGWEKDKSKWVREWKS